MYKQDQAKYSVVVNRRRAIPSIKDGLKPVQRRVVYGAYKDGLIKPSLKDKSASLVGLVMKKYHPHGDSSIYDTIVTLVDWFKTKYPLFYGKGNWGNVGGAGAAAQRYTECALSNFGYDVLIDLLTQSENIVDWLDTYKRNGDKEPEYLPAKLPLLLINGSFGIGVGMIFNVPSHNLGEVIAETRALIKNPKHKVVLIPDLAQPCELIGNNWEEISESGSGSFKVRGKIITEQDKKGNYVLRIISLPDMVTCEAVYEKILSMISDKQLPMIKDLNNVLKNAHPNIIIKLKQGADPEYVKAILYAKAGVQTTVSVNFEAVAPNGIDIKRYSYKEYLNTFIDDVTTTRFRLYCNRLQQVMTRHHRVDAFVKVISSKKLDQIINMIRKYSGTDPEPIVEYIIKNCGTTDLQARFIIDTKLSRLSAGYLKGYKEERAKLEQDINRYLAAVTDDGSIIRKEIYDELGELSKKYNTPRLCTVINSDKANDIPTGTFKVVITERNYVRKIPDVDKVGIVRKDNPKFIRRVDNAENLIIFDTKGKVFTLPVHKIPISDRNSSGVDIRILIKNLTSDIVNVFYEPNFKELSKPKYGKHYLTVVTRSNTIKKLNIDDFLNIGPSGLMYSKIRPEDQVVAVELVPANLDIAIWSGKKALRCSLKDVPLFKRNATGSKAMGVSEPINGMSVIYPDTTHIVVATKNGKFNRFDAALFAPHARGCKGSNAIKLDTTDEILGIFGVNENEIIRVLTSEGIEQVAVSDIKVKSNIAAGTKMIKSKGVIIKAEAVKR